MLASLGLTKVGTTENKPRAIDGPAQVWSKSDLDVWQHKFKKEFLKSVINRIKSYKARNPLNERSTGNTYDLFFKPQSKLGDMKDQSNDPEAKNVINEAKGGGKEPSVNEFAVFGSFASLVASIDVNSLEKQVWDVCSSVSRDAEINPDHLDRVVDVKLPRSGQCRKPYISVNIFKEEMKKPNVGGGGAASDASHADVQNALKWFYGEKLTTDPDVKHDYNQRIMTRRLASMLVADKIDMSLPAFSSIFVTDNSKFETELNNAKIAKTIDDKKKKKIESDPSKLGILAGKTAEKGATGTKFTLYTIGENAPLDALKLYGQPTEAKNDAQSFHHWLSTLNPTLVDTDNMIFQVVHALKVLSQAGCYSDGIGVTDLHLSCHNVKENGHFQYVVDRHNKGTPKKSPIVYHLPNQGKRYVLDPLENKFPIYTTTTTIQSAQGGFLAALIDFLMGKINTNYKYFSRENGVKNKCMIALEFFDINKVLSPEDPAPLVKRNLTTNIIEQEDIHFLNSFRRVRAEKDISVTTPAAECKANENDLKWKFNLDNGNKTLVLGMNDSTLDYDKEASYKISTPSDEYDEKLKKTHDISDLDELTRLYFRLKCMRHWLTLDTNSLPKTGSTAPRPGNTETYEKFLQQFYSEDFLDEGDNKWIRRVEEKFCKLKTGGYRDYTKPDLVSGETLAQFGWVETPPTGYPERKLRVRGKKDGVDYEPFLEKNYIAGDRDKLVKEITFEEFRKENHPRHVLANVKPARKSKLHTLRPFGLEADERSDEKKLTSDHTRQANPAEKIASAILDTEVTDEIDAMVSKIYLEWDSLPEGKKTYSAFEKIFDREKEKANERVLRMVNSRAIMNNTIKRLDKHPSLAKMWKKYSL